MIRLVKNTVIRLAVVVAVLAPLAFADSASAQCTPTGVSTTGQVSCDTTITLTIPAMIKVSNMTSTLDLGTFDGTTAPSAADNSVCVWTNTGEYYITATGDGTGSALTLQGDTVGNTDEIAYTVTWYPAINLGGTGVGLTSGIKSSAFSNVGNNPNCTGGDVASFKVDVSVTAASTASKDSYTGVLTLVFEPE